MVDYSQHNEELEFQSLLRRQLILKGGASVLSTVAAEFNALADYLKAMDDKTAATNYSNAAATVINSASKVRDLLQEKVNII